MNEAQALKVLEELGWTGETAKARGVLAMTELSLGEVMCYPSSWAQRVTADRSVHAAVSRPCVDLGARKEERSKRLHVAPCPSGWFGVVVKSTTVSATGRYEHRDLAIINFLTRGHDFGDAQPHELRYAAHAAWFAIAPAVEEALASVTFKEWEHLAARGGGQRVIHRSLPSDFAERYARGKCAETLIRLSYEGTDMQ